MSFQELVKLSNQNKWKEAGDLIPSALEDDQVVTWRKYDQVAMVLYYLGRYQESYDYYQKLFHLSDLPYRELPRLFQNLWFTEKKLTSHPNFPSASEIIKIYCEKGSSALYFEEHAYALAIYLIQKNFFIQMIQCPFTKIPKDYQSLHIIYGLHRYTGTPFPFKKYITHNMEHLDSWEEYYRGNPYDMFRRYLKNLAGAVELWDFSLENPVLYPIVAQKCHYVPVCLSSVYCYPKPAQIEQDIDILFLGAMNDRRRQILTQLKKSGYQVWDKKCYDRKGKGELYARSKIVLNINQYYPSRCVTSRMVPMLANNLCIISESSSDPRDDKILSDYVVFRSYDQLMETCERYLSQPTLREEVLGRQQESMWEKLSYDHYLSGDRLRKMMCSN